MKKNQNIDMLKAGSILLIIMYHCLAVTGLRQNITKLFHIDHFVGYGGEIGVTLFFILSGFGIFCSLHYREVNGAPDTWSGFMKRRIIRIVPQYYMCFLILIFCGQWANILGKTGIIHVVSHFVFLHNFSITTSGSLNGALWTMADIMQFYLIALFLYKALKKHPIFVCLASVVVTVVSKIIVFTCLAYYFGEDSWYYFVGGRQLLTALDNFVIGMTVGYFMTTEKEDRIKKNWIRLLLVLADIVLVDLLIIFSNSRNRLANTKTGWVWYSCLALVLGHFVWNFGHCRFKRNSRVLLWIARYEYGIYLWHYVLITNLYENSEWFRYIGERTYIIFTILMILISCIGGYISTLAVDEGIVKKWTTKNA